MQIKCYLDSPKRKDELIDVGVNENMTSEGRVKKFSEILWTGCFLLKRRTKSKCITLQCVSFDKQTLLFKINFTTKSHCSRYFRKGGGGFGGGGG
jgi:hypothetical protein